MIRNRDFVMLYAGRAGRAARAGRPETQNGRRAYQGARRRIGYSILYGRARERADRLYPR